MFPDVHFLNMKYPSPGACFGRTARGDADMGLLSSLPVPRGTGLWPYTNNR